MALGRTGDECCGPSSHLPEVLEIESVDAFYVRFARGSHEKRVINCSALDF